MRILKSKQFDKWLKNEKIDDLALKRAVCEVVEGLFDGNLGGNVFKKRISREGQGKRESYRTILAFKSDERMIFILGFAKKEKENITLQEKTALKRIAKDYLNTTDAKIDLLVKTKKLVEVNYDHRTK